MLLFFRYIAFLSVMCQAARTVAFLPPYFLSADCLNIFIGSLDCTAHFPVGSELHASN
jgi:hypothetical protein